jgi:hypothetical protein
MKAPPKMLMATAPIAPAVPQLKGAAAPAALPLWLGEGTGREPEVPGADGRGDKLGGAEGDGTARGGHVISIRNYQLLARPKLTGR